MATVMGMAEGEQYFFDMYEICDILEVDDLSIEQFREVACILAANLENVTTVVGHDIEIERKNFNDCFSQMIDDLKELVRKKPEVIQGEITKFLIENCGNCEWWAHTFSSADGVADCDRVDHEGASVKDLPKFFIEVRADDDQGLEANLMTGREFYCKFYKTKEEN